MMSSSIFNLWIIVFVGVTQFVNSADKNHCVINGKKMKKGSQYFTHSCYICTCLGYNLFDCIGNTCHSKTNHCKVGSSEVVRSKEIVMICSCTCIQTDRFLCDFKPCPKLLPSTIRKMVIHFDEDTCIIKGKSQKKGSRFFTADCYTCTCLGYNKFDCMGYSCPMKKDYCYFKKKLIPVKTTFKWGCNCTCSFMNRLYCDFTPCPTFDYTKNNIYGTQQHVPFTKVCTFYGVNLLPGHFYTPKLCYTCTCLGSQLVSCEGKTCPRKGKECYRPKGFPSIAASIYQECHCKCYETNKFYCDFSQCVPK